MAIKSCRKAITSARNKIRAAAKAEKNHAACERRALGRNRRQGDMSDMLKAYDKCSKQLQADITAFAAFDKAAARARVVCKDSTVMKNLYVNLAKTKKKLGSK